MTLTKPGGPESKMSKSVVLRLAIDEIERNRKEITRLQDEIKVLKSASPQQNVQSNEDGSKEGMFTFQNFDEVDFSSFKLLT